MKRCAALLLLFLAQPAAAVEISLDMSGLSYHFKDRVDRTEDWNQENVGGGITATWPGQRFNLFASGGALENSVDHVAAYIGGGVKKRFGGRAHVDIGLFVGGYYYGRERRGAYEGLFFPAAMPMVTLGYGRAAVNVVYLPQANGPTDALFFNASIRVWPR